MRRPSFARLAGRALLAIALALVAVSVWAWVTLHTPHAGWEGDAAEVFLRPGIGAGSVLRELAGAGVLRHPRVARAWLSWRGGGDRLQAGEYRFEEPLSPIELLERLQSGDVVLHAITLPEGLTISETAERFAAAGFGDRERLLAAFGDPAPILDFDPEAADLEGYLFPETYHFPRGETAERIARAMVRQFREAVGARFAEDAAQVGLSAREAVVLASLIEKETGVADERPRISRVFHNRLLRGMRLECDPTVIYALRRSGREVGRLTYGDLRFASPWNTYHAAGLPPGPIASPGRASLLASLSPASGDELYFVAAPGGGHRFSKSLQEHRRAVAEWRRYVGSSR